MERRPSLTMSSIIRACCLLTSRANGNQNLVFNSDNVEVMIGNLLFNPDDEASQSTHPRVLIGNLLFNPDDEASQSTHTRVLSIFKPYEDTSNNSDAMDG